MNFIIFDLEATCWQGNNTTLEQEIIEIGAIRMNDYGEVTGSYNRFVKPILNPYLSPFCKDLTGIEQDQVNRASIFKKVAIEFQDWIGVFEEDYLLCSWGAFDKKMLIKDSRLHQLDEEWAEPHLNLKRQYMELNRLHRPTGLKSALRKEGMEFEGNHHRGIDDAENLSRIFALYRDEWRY